MQWMTVFSFADLLHGAREGERVGEIWSVKP